MKEIKIILTVSEKGQFGMSVNIPTEIKDKVSVSSFDDSDDDYDDFDDYDDEDEGLLYDDEY